MTFKDLQDYMVEDVRLTECQWPRLTSTSAPYECVCGFNWPSFLSLLSGTVVRNMRYFREMS